MSSRETDYLIKETILSVTELIGKEQTHEQEKWQIESALEKVARNFSRLKAAYVKPTDFTSEESEFSSNLHTYLRKYGNNCLDSAIYAMVADGRGMDIWQQFIKSILELSKSGKLKSKKKEFIISRLHLDVMTTDDTLMKGLLYGWESSEFTSAIETVIEWTKNDN